MDLLKARYPPEAFWGKPPTKMGLFPKAFFPTPQKCGPVREMEGGTPSDPPGK